MPQWREANNQWPNDAKQMTQWREANDAKQMTNAAQQKTNDQKTRKPRSLLRGFL